MIHRALRLALVASTVLAAITPAAAQRAAPQPRACCAVTAIDAARGTVEALETASGKVFEFAVRNRVTLGALRVGQAVHANFARNQVSLDGRTVCCTITKGLEPRVAGTQQGAVVARAPVAANVRRYELPTISYGEPIPTVSARAPVIGRVARIETRDVSARVGGRTLSARLLHLNGREAIRSSGLPDGPRRLLEMHVMKLPKNASQYYIVNPQLAAQWAATHPVPPDIKPKEEKKDDSDCGTISITGGVDCFNDAVDAASAEWERFRERAEDWWNESSDRLAKEFGETQACFTDRVLAGPRTPVKFTISPTMPFRVEQGTSRGNVKGTVEGTVTLGVPMESDFQAGMDFFYIPCLPFVYRPRSIAADGRLTVGQQLEVNVAASGAFDRTFTVPPTGGPRIPLYVIPIVIGDVPVAVLDVSAYIEGEITVKGEGNANGRFALAGSQATEFEFTCDGGGCDGKRRTTSAPTSTNESARIEGRVSVEPGLYTALQLSLNYNILQGRAGPQPYLLGVADGCAAASASQSSGSPSGAAANAALTADLDWGMKLRAEALSGGQHIGKRWETKAMDERHIWFGDLAPGGSSALVPAVNAPAQGTVAQASTIGVKMPTCYPYTDRVQYRVTWTGGGTPAAPPGACSWQAGSGVCRFSPTQELALRLTWQTPGTYSVSVQLVRDEHRVFSPAPGAAQVSVAVGAGGGGAP